MPLPTWSVIAMVDEPAPLVVAFAQHMLAIGAMSVDLIFDNPNPQASALLEGLPGCRVTLADAAFWAATPGGQRPEANVDRQVAAAAITFARSEADWVLHCDADEFLRGADRLLTDLAALSPDVTHVTLRMAERVWIGAPGGLYAGSFRRMDWDWDDGGHAVQGELAFMFHNGLSGHIMGKSLTRRGSGMRPTVHYAMPEGDPGHPLGKRGPNLRAVRLLHFDGLTPLHFAIKLMRRVLDRRSTTPRAMAPARTAQIEHLRGLIDDPAGLARLVMRLMALSDAQAATLRARGLLEDRPFWPKVSPEIAAMLKPAALDKRLRGRHYRLLADHAPALLDAAVWDRCIAEAAAGLPAGAPAAQGS
jgi:hypothetical protein